MEAGFLDVTESNIGCPDEMPVLMPGTRFRSVGARFGPDVVWLFGQADPTIKRQSMLRSSVDKRLVRFTVEVPAAEALWWPQWSERQGIDREWYQTLAQAGRPTEWWVVERPIFRSEWVLVEARDSLADPWQELTASV